MVFVPAASIMDYINELIATSAKPNLRDFAMELHNRFYRNIDISFMDEFLEMASQENENQFVVHHDQLIKYGITTSGRSSNIKDRLIALGLVENVDYLLLDIQQQVPSGTKHKKVYHLTPEAFFLALQRSKRSPNQEVDPVIYARYFQFLQKVVRYYSEYQARAEAHRNAMLTDENKTLIAKIDKQTEKIDELKQLNLEQSAKMDQIMIYASDCNRKIDVFYDFVQQFAKMTLPMWVGSSVIKTQLDNFLTDHTMNYALKHLKVMFAIGFVGYNDDNVLQMITYISNTNFAEVSPRIKTLYNRHKDNAFMLRPEAVSLISCEINSEIVTLGRLIPDIFPEEVIDATVFERRTKSYITTDIEMDDVEDLFDQVVKNARGMRFQGYQHRMNEVLSSGACELNPKITDTLAEVDTRFFGSAIPLCDKFICENVSKRLPTNFPLTNYKYVASSQKTHPREDFAGQRMTNQMYALNQLKVIIDKDEGSTIINDMTKRGVISKKDISALKKIAEVENVDTSAIEIPETSSEEADDGMPPLLSDNEDEANAPEDGSSLTDNESDDSGYDTE